MYCDPSDIYSAVSQAKVKRLFDLEDGTSDVPDDSAIHPFIEIADAEINSVIGQRYVVPVTGEKSLLVLKGISSMLSIAALYMLRSEGDPPKAIMERADKMRELLPTIDLPDAVKHTGFVAIDTPRGELESVLDATSESSD